MTPPRRLARWFGRAVLLLAAVAAPLGAQSDDAASLVDRVRDDPTALPLPPADSVRAGGLVVPAGTTVGRVAVSGGTLEVLGTVSGDAIALGGMVVVRPGGRVLGNVFAARSQVQVDSGGRVDGEIRSIGGDVGAFPGLPTAAAKGPRTTLGALQLALAWFGVLLVLGLGVLVMASEYLDGVLDTLERGVARSLLVGLAGQLALAPALVVLVIGLSVTIIGILLVPFAVVAFCIAVAGLASLGFLAVAQLTGHALARRTPGTSARGAALRALVIGVTLYLSLWILAALFTWQPIAGVALRAAAFAVTWVVATAGFGAALLSRGGTRRASAPVAKRALPPDDFAWQTPTPVTGIAAARRPTPPPSRTPAA